MKKIKKKNYNYIEKYKKHVKEEVTDSEKKLMEALHRDRQIGENPFEFLNNLTINSYMPFEKLKEILYNKEYRWYFKQNSLIKLLLAKIIKGNKRLLNHREIIIGIFNVAYFKSFHLKVAAEWEFKPGNPYEEFFRLLRYLFDKYNEIPELLFKIWFKPLFTYGHRRWYGLLDAFDVFIHLSSGNNIRSFKYHSRNWDDRAFYWDRTFKIYIIKKAAGYFYTAPQEFNFNQAIRWSQFMCLCNDDKKSRALLKTRLIDAYDEHFNDPFTKYQRDFWTRVILFIVSSPQIPVRYYGLVAEYIYFIKFGYFNDCLHLYYPLKGSQPDFEIKDKEPMRILNKALNLENWFNQNKIIQGRINKPPKNMKFPKLDINKYYNVAYDFNGNKIEYKIKQITTKRELVKEGKIMRHCVEMYSTSCMVDDCLIWSLYKEVNKRTEKLLTIRINKSKEIVEIKGFKNRIPEMYEISIIKDWADREGIKMRL